MAPADRTVGIEAFVLITSAACGSAIATILLALDGQPWAALFSAGILITTTRVAFWAAPD